MDFYHKPVLNTEILSLINCQSGGKYLDCTVGGAGHAVEILSCAGPDGFLYGLDRDPDAIKAADKVLSRAGKNYLLINRSYRDIDEISRSESLPLLDGILFDLGVSSWQLDKTERGFSFSKEAELDMRFNQSENNTLTAADMVNNFSVEQLVEIFSTFGEEPYSKTIARAIVSYRQGKKIRTTTELADIINQAVNRKRKVGRVNPATRVFQALRMKVNDELAGIAETLPKAVRLLKSGGRLVVISFHSLEDRLVKEAFKTVQMECICPPRQPVCTCDKKKEGKIITRKPVTASEEEREINPRSRSAKVRVIERL